MSDPRIPAALTGADGLRPTAHDPLRWCVFTTVSLLTVVLGPAVLAVFAGTALVAYGRAWARGHRRSRCLLRDTRLVLLYLAVAFAVAAFAVARGW